MSITKKGRHKYIFSSSNYSFEFDSKRKCFRSIIQEESKEAIVMAKVNLNFAFGITKEGELSWIINLHNKECA